MRKIFESGRSLLETISVLAVIAVLLVAGLLGFKGVMDYFRHKETAKLIASLGAKNLLQPARNRSMGGGKEGIRVKDLCPTCDECNENNSFCVNGADGSQITMHADSEDNTSFWVVVKGAHPQSCREALLMGGYGLAIGGKNLNLDTGSEIASVDMKTAEFLRGHESNVEDTIRDFCCDNSDDPDDQLGKDCVQYLLYSKSSCKNYYDGTCHDCKKGWVLAPSGKKGSIDGCCLEGEVECGVCGGCVGKCVNGSCAECETNDDCTEKCDDEAGKVCNRYCVNGMCKPCQRVGDICYDKNGNPATGDCECNGCTPPKVFVEESSSCECPTTPLIQGNACDEDCPCSTGYICETRDSDTNSKCYCPETKPAKDEDCNLDCGCGTNDAGKQLYCIAGKCQLDACETDDDCADNTDGRTSCETEGENAGKCVCDKDKLEDDGTGKCRCKGDTGNTKEWFHYKSDKKPTEASSDYKCCPTGEHPSNFDMCCPDGYEAMELSNGEKACWACCTNNTSTGTPGESKIALILDYSYSTVNPAYTYQPSTPNTYSGKNFRTLIDNYADMFINRIPTDIKVAVYRDDPSSNASTSNSNCCTWDGGTSCAGPKTRSGNTQLQDFGNRPSVLSNIDDVCAYDCSSDGSGKTCFKRAKNAVLASDTDNTDNILTIIFADGAVRTDGDYALNTLNSGSHKFYSFAPNDVGAAQMTGVDIMENLPNETQIQSIVSGAACSASCTQAAADADSKTGTLDEPLFDTCQSCNPLESET